MKKQKTVKVLIEITKEILQAKYPTAAVVFLAGSIVRGEATAFSDLDLVVIFENLPIAFRESFYFRGFPVESFVHTPETLNYFFEQDGKSRVPSLAVMVAEGLEVPEKNDLSEKLKRRATEFLAHPPELSEEENETLRYRITDAIDDLREPRSKEELTASATDFYPLLADFFLRSNGFWSASKKAIPRYLRKANPEFCTKFCEAFEELFGAGNSEKVVKLTEDLLKPHGGLIFDGFRREANVEGRKPIE